MNNHLLQKYEPVRDINKYLLHKPEHLSGEPVRDGPIRRRDPPCPDDAHRRAGAEDEAAQEEGAREGRQLLALLLPQERALLYHRHRYQSQ